MLVDHHTDRRLPLRLLLARNLSVGIERQEHGVPGRRTRVCGADDGPRCAALRPAWASGQRPAIGAQDREDRPDVGGTQIHRADVAGVAARIRPPAVPRAVRSSTVAGGCLLDVDLPLHPGVDRTQIRQRRTWSRAHRAECASTAAPLWLCAAWSVCAAGWVGWTTRYDEGRVSSDASSRSLGPRFAFCWPLDAVLQAFTAARPPASPTPRALGRKLARVQRWSVWVRFGWTFASRGRLGWERLDSRRASRLPVRSSAPEEAPCEHNEELKAWVVQAMVEFTGRRATDHQDPVRDCARASPGAHAGLRWVPRTCEAPLHPAARWRRPPVSAPPPARRPSVSTVTSLLLLTAWSGSSRERSG